MEKVIKMKPGDTMVGLFNKLGKKEKGYKFHVSVNQLNYDGVRQLAVMRNREARLLKEIKKWELKFSVSKMQREGYITITHVDNSIEKP